MKKVLALPAISLSAIMLSAAGLSPSQTPPVPASAATEKSTAPADDPLLRPIAPDYAKRWLTPEAPIRVFGNTYLVGFGGISVGLIKTSAGLILIDGAVPQAVADLEANIRELGFSIRDVKLILSTEPHYDHAGGLAALARDSGATVIASAPAAAVLASGGRDANDPQADILEPFPIPARIRAVRDGDAIRLGDVTVMPIATPGHTTGSMSWRWRSCEGKDCADVLFASSLNPVSAPNWRFAAHPERVSLFRATFAKVRALPCDILLSAHPDQSGGDTKLARLRETRTPNPFRDPGACLNYAERFNKSLESTLNK